MLAKQLTMSILLASVMLTSSSVQTTPEAIEHLMTYLRINTAHPNPDYTSAITFLLDLTSSIPNLEPRVLHFTPDNSKPLLLLTLNGSSPSLPSILLNSHLDSVPAEPLKWSHPPFAAHLAPDGRIFARGAQDDKCIAIQLLEAIKNLVASGFAPVRTLHVSFVPDEEVGGADGMAKFAASKEFRDLNVGFALDEGQASPSQEFRVFYADRAPWHVVIKALGQPGHGSRMYDNSALENLMKSVELIANFREAQFDTVKAGLAANSEVVSVNPVYFKAGIVSNEVSKRLKL